MKIQNEVLKQCYLANQYSESVIAHLEAIGIEIYSKYGIDCYNYAIKGSPIDIVLIHDTIQKIQAKGLDLTENGYLAIHGNIHEWASLIVDFWNRYPNY